MTYYKGNQQQQNTLDIFRITKKIKKNKKKNAFKTEVTQISRKIVQQKIFLNLKEKIKKKLLFILYRGFGLFVIFMGKVGYEEK